MKNAARISRITRIVAKIMEITHWVAAGLMAATAICSMVAPQWIGYFIDAEALKNSPISTYGFEVTPVNSAGEINLTALCLFSIAAVIIFSAMGMIFRNIYLIVRKSEGSTPFQSDNIRMLKEIGIFSIAIPATGLIMSGIMRLATGVDTVETSVDLYGFTMGIFVLCLTHFFAHGMALEKDVEGLL